jgi:UDP-N-acetylmuramate dehydrogenase
MIIIEESYSLKSYNTFGLRVSARFFAEAGNIEDMQTVVKVFGGDSKPKLILGGGSNILFTKDFDGVVIFPDMKGRELINQDEDNVWVKAYAGENWDQFVAYCVSENWGGIENLSLIPGNIGACPIQNIGAYGVEAKDVIDSVETIDMQTGEIRIFKNAECKFGYRDSIFKKEEKGKYLITSVTFRLSKKPVFQINYFDVSEELKKFSEINIAHVRQSIINIRRRKLPDHEQYGNAGSFFKNPLVLEEKFQAIRAEFPDIPSYPAENGFLKVPAAWLIQTCGWKGKREGNVGTFATQPLVIINYGEATGVEILDFSEKIRQSVLNRFGIGLETEVNII